MTCLSLCSVVSTRRCVMALGTRSVTVFCTRRVYDTSSLCMSPHSYSSPLLSCRCATCAGHGTAEAAAAAAAGGKGGGVGPLLSHSAPSPADWSMSSALSAVLPAASSAAAAPLEAQMTAAAPPSGRGRMSEPLQRRRRGGAEAVGGAVGCSGGCNGGAGAMGVQWGCGRVAVGSQWGCGGVAVGLRWGLTCG